MSAGAWWAVALGGLVLLLIIEAYAEQIRYERRQGRPTRRNRGQR
ncbi:hypothetical protein [Kitasatospora sp. NBC_01266]|nr:hypothetical protein [Kitasatospora sp. NBC_01266]